MTALEESYLSMLENNQHRIMRICSAYAEDEEDQKDLFQEVLLQLWRSFASFEGRAQLATWVYKVSLNTCLRKKYRRKDSHQKISIEDLEWSEPSADSPNERINYLRQCIKFLLDADQMLVVLFLEGLSYQEIKDVVGISENHVAVKMKRIRKKLFHCINEKL